MKNLPLPDNTDIFVHLETALTYANGERIYDLTQDEKNQIGLLYTRYDDLFGCPASELKGETLSEKLRENILHSYSEVQEGRRLQNLRDSLKSVAERCPYCGIGAVTDLDHHLPKKDFPALSIYARNLIPTCHECNNKKRSIADYDSDKQFVHAYLEAIPDERFLFFKIDIVDSRLSVKMEIRKSSIISERLYQRIVFQVGRLNLDSRYTVEIIVQLRSIYKSLEYVFGRQNDSFELSKFLNETGEENAINFGINDWRAAMYFGLAENQEFCSGGFRDVLN